ncbi:hypothetical protein KP775_11815 [Streptococcus equi subsp. equi]|uniref:hypothetical protein n=1 Tax=Streptococcus equi TaxID=1336 RepID=UPI001E2BF821|nr:hypothetical protein [Streptococcus equi]MCD3512037.1 hypothetical protein [Streptococcus equi subsp. equi]
MITKNRETKKTHNNQTPVSSSPSSYLITGSLMGTGLLGNKVVYGDMKSDAKKVLATLQKGNHKQELKKVLKLLVMIVCYYYGYLYRVIPI